LPIKKPASAGSTIDTIHLARGRDDDILLTNRKEGLPIDAPCQAKQKSEPNDDYQQATRSRRQNLSSRPHADRGLPLGPEWGYAR
jgi:hypothetical protein